MARLSPHDHLCLIYEPPDEDPLAATVPFIRNGLERGEQCLYILDEEPPEVVLDAMRGGGIDTESTIRSGALKIATTRETYLREGRFDPDDMIRLLGEYEAAAKAAGFNALRVTAEMVWTSGDETENRRFVEYESRLRRFLATHDVVALCRYNRSRFPTAPLCDAIRRHPKVVSNAIVCDNLYYPVPVDPPAVDAATNEVNEMLAHMREREMTRLPQVSNGTLLRAMINAITESAFLIDTNGIVLACNEAIATRLGCRVSDLVGRRMSDFTPPAVNEKRKRYAEQVIATGEPARFEDAFPTHVIDISMYPVMNHRGKVAAVAVFARDVSDGRRLESRLQESRAEYRRIVETANEGIWVLDAQQAGVFLNEGMASSVGYTVDEMLGRKVAAFMFDEDLPDHEARMRARRAGVSERYERRLRHRDGSVRWMLVSAAPLMDSGGQFAGSFGMFTDITDRKHLEDALRENEQRYRAIANYTYDWETWIGTDGRPKWISPSVERMTGYTVEECLAMPDFPLPLIHPDDREGLSNDRAMADCEELLDGRDFRVVRKDGTIRWGSLVCQPIYDDRGTHLGHRSSIRDVTKHKEAENTLRESEERHRTILQTAMDGFCMVDMEGRIREVNKAYCRMSGYSESELLTMCVPDVEALLTSEEAAGRAQQIMAQGEDRFESHHRRKDGSVYDVEVSAQYRPIGGGRIIAFIRDISERKRVEEEKRRLEEQVRQVQTLDALGHLAAGVAHDFSNMLTVIQGQVAIARAAIDTNHPASEPLEAVRDAAGQAAEITRSLLTFSRVTPTEKKRLDLWEVIREARNLLRHALPARVRLVDEIEAARGHTILADRTQIHQVLVNLAINAHDAMPRGGTLRLRVSDEAVPEKTPRGRAARTRWIQITLADTGAGIDPVILPRVFEPFFTTKPRGKGTGLGLSLVHGIVSDHGGRIEVASRVGEGTTFTITLPVLSPKKPDRAPGQAGRLLLVAIHDLYQAAAVGGHLQSAGCRVLTTNSTNGLLNLLDSHRGDAGLAVFGGDLPGDAVRECLLRIRATSPRLPIIVLPGVSPPPADSEDEATQVLHAPITLGELERLVKQTMPSKKPKDRCSPAR